MPRKLDLIGARFGHLTVTGDSGKRSAGNVYWNCKCDCGNEVIVRTAALRTGATVSCGCVRKSKSAANLSTLSAIDKLQLVDHTNGSRIKHERPPKNNTSGIRGVYRARKNGKYINSWIAYIYYKRKRYHLGSYPTIEAAAEARARAAEARLQDFEAILAKIKSNVEDNNE